MRRRDGDRCQTGTDFTDPADHRGDPCRRPRSSEEAMARLSQEKEEKSRQHKSFFAEREELSDERRRLDKEVFRLNSQNEKLEEAHGCPDQLHVGGVRA